MVAVVAIGCLVYNVAFAFLGGIEYETVDVRRWNC